MAKVEFSPKQEDYIMSDFDVTLDLRFILADFVRILYLFVLFYTIKTSNSLEGRKLLVFIYRVYFNHKGTFPVFS